MPFDDLLTPVAVPDVPRHDTATCRGERQEPDVGEGWEEVKLHDTLKFGDQIFIKALGVWQDTCKVGLYHKTADIYRRRVAPDERPLGAFLDEENNTLRAENATLRSEVERLRLTDAELKAVKYFAGPQWTRFHPLCATLDSLLRRLGVVI